MHSDVKNRIVKLYVRSRGREAPPTVLVICDKKSIKSQIKPIFLSKFTFIDLVSLLLLSSSFLSLLLQPLNINHDWFDSLIIMINSIGQQFRNRQLSISECPIIRLLHLSEFSIFQNHLLQKINKGIHNTVRTDLHCEGASHSTLAHPHF